jgi:uncharacterized protein YbjT (DUF2867 family)
MNKIVLVTGATGSIGQSLSHELEQHGFEVRVASRNPNSQVAHGKTVRFDWDQPESYDAALEGAGGVYLTFPERIGGSDLIVQFIERAQSVGVERIVLLSAMGVEVAAVETGMGAVEQAIQNSAMNWTILRPNTFMQNFTEGDFGRSIRDRRELTVSVGGASLSFIDTRDIAAVAAIVLTSKTISKRILELTGPESLSFEQAVDSIRTVSGHEVRVMDLPAEHMKQILVHAAGMPEARADLLMLFFAGIRSGQNSPVLETVRDITGRNPRTFAEFVQEHARSWDVGDIANKNGAKSERPE